MKKIILVLTIITLMVSITTFAENQNLIDGKWKKANAGEFSQTTEDGVTVYTATGINAGYKSPAIDIYPAVKKAMGEDDEVTLSFSCEVRADYSGDANFTGQFVMRGGNVSAEANKIEPDEFGNIYEGTLFRKNDSVNIIANLPEASVVFTEEWQYVSVTFEVYREDLSDGVFGQWNMCFSAMKGYENITALHIRNATLTVGEAEKVEDTTPKPTEKAEKVEDTTPKPTEKAPEATNAPEKDDETKPQATENNSVVKTPMATNAPDPEATPEVVMVKTKGLSTADVVFIVVDVIQFAIIACLAVILIKKKKS